MAEDWDWDGGGGDEPARVWSPGSNGTGRTSRTGKLQPIDDSPIADSTSKALDSTFFFSNIAATEGDRPRTPVSKALVSEVHGIFLGNQKEVHMYAPHSLRVPDEPSDVCCAQGEWQEELEDVEEADPVFSSPPDIRTNGSDSSSGSSKKGPELVRATYMLAAAEAEAEENEDEVGGALRVSKHTDLYLSISYIGPIL